MSLVDVVLTIGEGDVVSNYDCRVLDSLERMYPLSRSVQRVGLLPRLHTALDKALATQHTFLGRRPLELPRCLTTDSEYEHLVVVLPLGSTGSAVNAAYSFLKEKIDRAMLQSLDSYELNSDIRTFAHNDIVPRLDTMGEFSRYPFDYKIAFDLMFTMKLAMTSAQIGRGAVETIDTIYLDIDSMTATTSLSKRETRQMALLFKYRPLPR